jgi:hypothetical protein
MSPAIPYRRMPHVPSADFQLKCCHRDSIAQTLVMGFREDVAICIRADSEDSRVDIRLR